MQHYRREKPTPTAPQPPASEQLNELGLKGPLSPLAEDALSSPAFPTSPYRAVRQLDRAMLKVNPEHKPL